MKITLAYAEQPLTDLAYDSEYEFQKELNTLKFYDTPIIGLVSGRTLRGRQYEHITYRDTEFTVVITADELIMSANRTFINNFWLATHKYLRIDGDYIAVLSGGGALPREFINENKYLPEVTLKLVANGIYS